MNLVIISSGNDLVPVQHQPITWINADLLSISAIAANFTETWINIQKSFLQRKYIWKCRLQWQPFCSGLDVLREDNLPEFVDLWRITQQIRASFLGYLSRQAGQSRRYRCHLCWLYDKLNTVRPTCIRTIKRCGGSLPKRLVKYLCSESTALFIIVTWETR